jgi:hypothetical protein
VAAALLATIGYAWAVREPRARPHGASTATPTLSPQATSSSTTATPTPSTASLPGIGAAPAGPGLVVTVRVQPAGELVVAERLAWTPRKAPATVTLSMPRRVSGAGVPAGTYASPRLTSLQVAYDGGVVAPHPALTAQQQVWTFAAPTSAAGRHVVALRYRLAGVAVPSTPGPPGRVTVVVVPVLLNAARALPVWLSVVAPPGGTVRGVNCPLAAPERVVCADQRAGGWLVTASGARSADLRRITVQADLPAG